MAHLLKNIVIKQRSFWWFLPNAVGVFFLLRSSYIPWYD
jgi:hypothetical protein